MGLTNRYAAWSYLRPSPLARKIKEHVAFLRGVVVEGTQEPAKGSAVGAWGKARVSDALACAVTELS